MFPSRKLFLLASVFAFLFSFNAGAANTSDPTVAELVRLLQDGSDYLMKMVAQSDPRVAEILLTKQTDGETTSSTTTMTTTTNGTANSTFLESLENDLDDLFTTFLSSIDPNDVNAAQVASRAEVKKILRAKTSFPRRLIRRVSLAGTGRSRRRTQEFSGRN